MEIPLFLAITGQELCQSIPLPHHSAWMACHFSPYTLGLTDLPPQLPPDSMLILDDRIEPTHHTPEGILPQLLPLAERFSCVLLDFQRKDNPLLRSIADSLTCHLPCPVAVTPQYAQDLPCPVLLPPLPHNLPLEDHLRPWQGRTLWLELATEPTTLSVTPSGCHEIPAVQASTPIHHCPALHTHYQMELAENEIRFTFHRTQEDFHTLLRQAAALGVEKAVGLYQQLWDLAL